MTSEPPRQIDDVFSGSTVPTGRPREYLDARELPPPQPLQRTLERLTELDDETVLVQFNDRVPQHLFPRLRDRGCDFETVSDDDVVVTAIWPAEE